MSLIPRVVLRFTSTASAAAKKPSSSRRPRWLLGAVAAGVAGGTWIASSLPPVPAGDEQVSKKRQQSCCCAWTVDCQPTSQPTTGAVGQLVGDTAGCMSRYLAGAPMWCSNRRTLTQSCKALYMLHVLPREVQCLARHVFPHTEGGCAPPLPRLLFPVCWLVGCHRQHHKAAWAVCGSSCSPFGHPPQLLSSSSRARGPQSQHQRWHPSRQPLHAGLQRRQRTQSPGRLCWRLAATACWTSL